MQSFAPAALQAERNKGVGALALQAVTHVLAAAGLGELTLECTKPAAVRFFTGKCGFEVQLAYRQWLVSRGPVAAPEPAPEPEPECSDVGSSDEEYEDAFDDGAREGEEAGL